MISIIVVAAIVAFFLVKRKSKKSSSDLEKLGNQSSTRLPSTEVHGMHMHLAYDFFLKEKSYIQFKEILIFFTTRSSLLYVARIYHVHSIFHFYAIRFELHNWLYFQKYSIGCSYT